MNKKSLGIADDNTKPLHSKEENELCNIISDTV